MKNSFLILLPLLSKNQGVSRKHNCIKGKTVGNANFSADIRNPFINI